MTDLPKPPTISPSLKFMEKLIRITFKARQSGIPPETIAKYLRDMAEDVAENTTK